MSPAYKTIPVEPFLRGLAANTDPYSEPKGTFRRGSNLLLNKRGAVDTCDGSQLIHAFNGAVQSGRGKNMDNFLFAPTGVSRYYLSIFKALDVPLGAPQNLVLSDGGTGGTLTGTFFYKVTALDGAGGETLGSVEATITVAANHKITLTWNVVPNAAGGYNVYRSTTTNNEGLLASATGAVIPVAQAATGTLTVTFTDPGNAIVSATPVSIVSFTASKVGSSQLFLNVITTAPHGLSVGQFGTVAGTSVPSYNSGTYTVHAVIDSVTLILRRVGLVGIVQNGTGGTFTPSNIPVPSSDTTQQTALYRMPLIVGSPAALPVSYNNSNIVALYPADILPSPDGGGGGGSGGGGGTGGGGTTGGGSTVGGGIPGNVSFIPQIVQFTNRAVIALGNGFPPQIYSDASGTPVNPATVVNISTVTVDAFGVVTITTATAHGITASQIGANVLLENILNNLYNGAFVTIAVPSTTTLKVRNLAAIGQAGSSGGKLTVTSVPLTSSFTPAFPVWSATTSISVNSIVQPTVANGHYYKAIQGGTTGSSQPTFPTGTGQQVADGSCIWQEAGLTNTAAPAPPGAAHILVYAGSLWVLNTSPTNTSTGIDGPCSIRMSDVNNPLSWNPINQAFLDKDDGTEGMGLASFTITAQGIPPEGSLIVFKNFSSYQIVGVFGSTNLAIQRVKTDMGCLAPRTIQFVPGFGIMRYTHLGFANFGGVDDLIVSEDIRVYLFPTNDFSESDLTVLDSTWQSVMWGFQTASPPMYCVAAPIGVSGGQLTRIFCYDLVLKAWAAPIDLPFPIATAAQFKSVSANPVTILGGFSDGLLSRWQAGDQMWDTGATGVRLPSQVNFMVQLPDVATKGADQKLYCRRIVIRGIATTGNSLTVTPIIDGNNKPSATYPIPLQGDFELFASFQRDGLRFAATITGSGQLELDRFAFHVSPKAVGVPKVLT